MEKVHTTAARSGFPHQNVKTLHVRITFWKLRCSKSARRCGTKHMSKLKCANPSDPENFWKLRCWKSARRCGAKRISKSKLLKTVSGSKHFRFKKCTPLWREAHFQIKMLKHCMFGAFLDVHSSFCAAGARNSAPSKTEQNVRAL